MVEVEKVKINNQILNKLAEYGEVLENAALKEYTTFKTGGNADILIFPNNNEDIINIIKIASENNLPITVIGGGSNLLVGDHGIRGIVICMKSNDKRTGKIYFTDDEYLYADAIIKKEDFINFAVENGYGGVEFLVGVPGSIGGGIIMNAGTFMGTFIDILKKVVYIDKNGNLKEKEINKNMATYRFFDLNDALVIVGGYFKLPKVDNADDVKKKIQDIIDDRNQKHPSSYPCAGSVFKNPEGYQSWKLVNDAGLKGMRIGDAIVSDLHTNFIINIGEATSNDVRELIHYVQEKVYEKYSIKLHTEIRMIGEF